MKLSARGEAPRNGFFDSPGRRSFSYPAPSLLSRSHEGPARPTQYDDVVRLKFASSSSIISTMVLSPVSREVYPSAPLRFVALEAQLSYAPVLATEQGRAEVYNRLSDVFPVAEPETSVEVAVGLGGAAPPKTTVGLRMVNLDRTRSVSVTPTSLTVQTSAFVDPGDFLESVQRALEALLHARPSLLRRIGLRYIDEIRAPHVAQPADWRPYIDERLLGPVLFAGAHQVDAVEGVLALTIGRERHLVLRHGPRVGYAVEPNGVLRLPPSPGGPFFLLDIDSFWMPSPDERHRFDVDDALAICHALDDPAHDYFEAAITDRLRDEILRRPA